MLKVLSCLLAAAENSSNLHVPTPSWLLTCKQLTALWRRHGRHDLKTAGILWNEAKLNDMDHIEWRQKLVCVCISVWMWPAAHELDFWVKLQLSWVRFQVFILKLSVFFKETNLSLYIFTETPAFTRLLVRIELCMLNSLVTRQIDASFNHQASTCQWFETRGSAEKHWILFI